MLENLEMHRNPETQGGTPKPQGGTVVWILPEGHDGDSAPVTYDVADKRADEMANLVEKIEDLIRALQIDSPVPETDDPALQKLLEEYRNNNNMEDPKNLDDLLNYAEKQQGLAEDAKDVLGNGRDMDAGEVLNDGHKEIYDGLGKQQQDEFINSYIEKNAELIRIGQIDQDEYLKSYADAYNKSRDPADLEAYEEARRQHIKASRVVDGLKDFAPGFLPESKYQAQAQIEEPQQAGLGGVDGTAVTYIVDNNIGKSAEAVANHDTRTMEILDQGVIDRFNNDLVRQVGTMVSAVTDHSIPEHNLTFDPANEPTHLSYGVS